jgi:hypothetical protein
VTNQTFGADTTNWTRGTGWTFNGTVAVATAATGTLTYTPALTITNGNAYEITYTLASYSAGTLTAAIGNVTYTLPTHNATANVVVLLPTSATGGFRFTTSTFTGNLDNVSVVQIANPASVLLAGQNDNDATIYSSIQMPSAATIGFGTNAGRYATGTSNNFFGANAGRNNTTGFNNNFFGTNAGQNNTSGYYNNFFGFESGIRNTTGFSNNCFGLYAGFSLTTASNNNFFGSYSGYSNTTGSNNNFFGLESGNSNTTGSNNNFFGLRAGYANTSGNINLFIGNSSGRNNTSGSNNIFLGEESGFTNASGLFNIAIGAYRTLYLNRISNYNIAIGFQALSNTRNSYNIGIGESAGENARQGQYNMFLGQRAGYNATVADTLTGSNNIAIGRNAADNISAAAAANVAIGNQVDLPTNNGSNQGVYQNVLFFTGASGTGTTIAAASKAGIKTNAPNRDLEVAGEVRITDLTTDAPTRLVGADADGDLGQVTLGAGLSLASSSLLADTNFLVTRFDTASMLTNYLRTGTAAGTYLTGSGTTNYIPKFTGTRILGNSLVYDSGTKIGIGNIDPNYLLDLKTNDNAKIFLRGGIAQNGILFDTISSVNSFYLFNGTLTTSGFGIYDVTNNINRLWVKNDGNIGVGTTSPNAKLDVNGTILTSRLNIAGGNQNSILLNNASNGITSGFLIGRSFATNNLQDLFIYDIENAAFRLNINSSGNIGIGTTNPAAKLEVHGSAVFNEGSADADFRVESDGNANMVFVDASTDRVGIGYASPTKTLDVNGEVRINTVTATPTSLLGKDGSNVVGEVTTVAQTGLMTRGETTATTGSPSAIFTVTHGLGATPTSVLVTSAGLAGAEKIIFEVYGKNDTTFSVQAWNYDGTEASSKSVKIFWLAIK